ncbi:TPA: peptidase domain-containing ABC transporter [Streptococcus pneumoniae]|nr:peptidase domain-containing ABC transporter [Streptococcus pneumoniae]
MKRNIPFIEQHQKTECGLCCVAMVSNFYNHEISVKDLRNLKETGRDGTSFQNLIELLENMGFKVKSFRFPKDRPDVYKQIKVPAIALWESKHFVVVEKVTSKFVWVIDPELGKLRYDLNEFSAGFSEFLISISSSDRVIKQKSKENYGEIYAKLWQSWHYFVPLLFLTFVSYAVSFILPIWTQQLLNQATGGNQFNPAILALNFIIFTLLYFIIMLGQRYLSINLTNDIDKRLNNSVIGRLFQLPYKFFSTRSSGDLIYSINGLGRIRQLFTNQVVLGILDIGFVICILFYFLYIDFFVTIIALMLVVINLLLLLLTRKNLEQKSKSFVIAQNDLQNKQIEMIYSMMGIKMEGFEVRTFKQWKGYLDKYLYRYRASELFSSVVNSLFSIITFISPFILLFIMLLSDNHLGNKLGGIFAVYSLSSLLFGKINSIFDTIVAFYNSKTFLSRILEILGEETEINGVVKHDLNGEIALKNVSFSYTRDSKKVLSNVSIEIKKGEKVAIVGSSGSGKSTLSKLLIGLFPASSGSILFDDLDYNLLDKQYLRQQIGIVPQDMTLFNKTIHENIAGDISVSEEEMTKICKLVNIHDEIMEMPMGYNTLVSEMGMNLSGGQRQRIILARALVKKPKIILLDEATSYLDNVNENEIMQKFKEQNITIIVIAHRLSTIIDSNQIFVMDKGEIVEQGSHTELLNMKNGLYKKLYQTDY